MSEQNTKQVGGDHYKSQVIQAWDFIALNNIPYLEGNIIKYVSRWRVKNGVEDLKKAQHYLQKLIELETAWIEGHGPPPGDLADTGGLPKAKYKDRIEPEKPKPQGMVGEGKCTLCGSPAGGAYKGILYCFDHVPSTKKA